MESHIDMDEITLVLNGIIDECQSQEIHHALNRLEKGDLVNLEINSLGGSMMHIFDMHSHMEGKLNMNIATLGMATTSGVYFLAHDFKKIRIKERGKIHFIKSHICTIEEDSKIIDDYRSLLSKMDEKIINALAKRSGKRVEFISRLMDQSSELSSKDALIWGFVDEIITED